MLIAFTFQVQVESPIRTQSYYRIEAAPYRKIESYSHYKSTLFPPQDRLTG